MIKTIEIKNFKTIKDITIELGRINVFIGENGAGKSNILEAIALVAAAASNKLDNEFLASRGIRVTSASLMRQAFDQDQMILPIEITVSNGSEEKQFLLNNDSQPYSKWESTEVLKKFSGYVNYDNLEVIPNSLRNFLGYRESIKDTESLKEARSVADEVLNALKNTIDSMSEVINELKEIEDDKPVPNSFINERIKSQFNLPLVNEEVTDKFNRAFSIINNEIQDFLIYSPENSSLKTFEKEGQIEPLGVNGEGLLQFITFISNYESDTLLQIKSNLKVLGWFKDFELNEDAAFNNTIKLKDKYVKDNAFLEQLSVNEGFLFLLFYFSLFCSKKTPTFFAIDNIDASLNPKLCEKLIKLIASLSSENNKQVILTTHNPSVLDGLNLNDEEQRLFVISRSPEGFTRLKQVKKPSNASNDNRPQRMSQLFISGALGGIPKRF